jgi:2-amino-4-hydroxy-6-hydroxymethyldihydropteridine diphosphokinase
MISMTDTILSIGSNLGHRKNYLQKAKELLAKDDRITVVKESSIHETSPVGMAAGTPSFLNQVIWIETSYKAKELLKVTQSVEKQLGRKDKTKGTMSSRTIDIDIIFYGDTVMNEENLTIPHPRFQKRDFVMVPLKEIAMDWVKNRINNET